MIRKICNTLVPYRTYIQYECFTIQIISILFSTFFKLNLIIIDAILMSLATFFFLGLKDEDNDSDGILEMFKIYKWQMIVGTTACVNDILWKASETLALFRLIGLLLLILIPIIAAISMSKEGIKESLNMLAMANIWDSTESGLDETGDVILGESEDGKKPLYLKYKDRFLHMLILGPTGCGKTSQIITPMIYSDLKNHKLGLIVLEPKGDLAERVNALASFEGRQSQYFNPSLKDCPYFNPLRGDETDVIENLVTTFQTFDTDSKAYFKDSNENLVRRSLKILKRLYGDDANLNQLDMLINNVGGAGTKMVNDFSKLPPKNIREKNENDSIVDWFVTEYLPGTNGGGARGGAKTFESSSGVRNQIQKLISNTYLNKVLNPPTKEEAAAKGETLEYLDFDKILAEGGVCSLCSAQGKLRELGTFLGFFLILQIQSAVFRRPGNEFNRPGCMLYIDEFQKYANSGMQDMLTQGRSYRVGCILATQNRSLIGQNSGGKQGKDFTDIVSTNARNVVIFPGANGEDANYYSKEFGEEKIMKENIAITRQRFGFDLAGQKENVRNEEKYEARYRPTDIIYRDFGEAVIRIMKNNSVQKPQLLKLSFIPKDINDKANEFIEKVNEENELNFEEEFEEPVTAKGFFSIDETVDDLEEYNTSNNITKKNRDDNIGAEDIFDDM